MKRENKKIENIIRELRKARGVSQMDLAEKIGVSYQQVQKYETGATALTVNRIKQIARALEVSVSVFFPSEKENLSEILAPYGKLNEEEELLLHLFRGIKSQKARAAILEFMKTFTGKK